MRKEHPPEDHARIDVAGGDAWAELVAGAFVPLRVDTDEPGFRGAMREQLVGDLAISQVASTRVTVSRTARSTVTDPREVVMLCLFLRGSGTTVQDGRITQFTGGGGFLLDGDQPYSLRFSDGNEVLALRLPRQYLEISNHTLGRLTSREVPKSAAGLNVLRRYLSGLVAMRRPLPQEQLEQQHELALELLHAALHPMVYSERSRALMSGAAILASARWFIDVHHADPRLTVEDVAREFMVSRRHLETQFARLGPGPAAYLRRVRLRHAARLLRTGRRGQVAAIAAASGFSDVNTFVRAFRREYGATPDEWRRSEQRGPRPGAAERRRTDLLSDLSGFDWTDPGFDA
ncbi:AraC family transcriptional regulator [Nocardioides sp. WV_118_6]